MITDEQRNQIMGSAHMHVRNSLRLLIDAINESLAQLEKEAPEAAVVEVALEEAPAEEAPVKKARKAKES